MHIGAWQELRLYKILVLRENYRHNGLSQLSSPPNVPGQPAPVLAQPAGKREPSPDTVSAASHTLTSSAKTTITDHQRFLSGPARQVRRKRGCSCVSHVPSVSRRTRRPDPKVAATPVGILKRDYEQWQQYEAAKEKASKVLLEDFAPPPVPRPMVRKPPLQRKRLGGDRRKPVAQPGVQNGRERIEKMRAMYGIKYKTADSDKKAGAGPLPPLADQKKKLEQEAKTLRSEKEEKKTASLPLVKASPLIKDKSLPPIAKPAVTVQEEQKFNSEYAKREEKAKRVEQEIEEVTKEWRDVDEGEIDKLLQWVQELPEELSSSQKAAAKVGSKPSPKPAAAKI